MTIQKLHKQQELSDRILDIIYHIDEFTTSDLQGLIDAVIMDALNFND